MNCIFMVGVGIEFLYCCRVPKAHLIPQNKCSSITNTTLKTQILIRIDLNQIELNEFYFELNRMNLNFTFNRMSPMK